MHEDEQPVSPSELPPEFNDSSESESSSDANSDCIDLASDAENYVDPDSDDEEGIDFGESYDSD